MPEAQALLLPYVLVVDLSKAAFGCSDRRTGVYVVEVLVVGDGKVACTAGIEPAAGRLDEDEGVDRHLRS